MQLNRGRRGRRIGPYAYTMDRAKSTRYSLQAPFTSNASTVNAFKALLDKFWSHQAVKFDFTADLTNIGNQ